MTVRRGIGLLAMLTAIALTAVHLRTEQTRSAARIERLTLRGVDLRRISWTLDVQIARARAPRNVRDRAEGWALGLTPNVVISR